MAKINLEAPIILLGAGLSSGLMAAYLGRRGFKVEVYERRPDPRTTDLYVGKSINLAISVRGLFAMKDVGLEDAVKEMCIPMHGRMIHDRQGNTDFQFYSKDGQKAINSISRGDLNILLINTAASFPNVSFHFDHRCVGMDLDTGEALLLNEKTGENLRVSGQTVIACDGAFSGARASLLRSPRFNFSQTYHPASYKELSFRPSEDGKWRIESNALHIWPRGSFMLIALPNMDGSFTVTLFYPAVGPDSFETLNTAEAVEAFFAKEFPDAKALIPNLAEEFFSNPTGELVTVKCDPWHFGGKCALVGDAAHAVVPFYGQGMNAAFEDCTVLNNCIVEGKDWEEVFAEYSRQRVANGQAIADMAVDNYFEMRDRVGDPNWRFRKLIEHKLEKTFPESYVSRYEMVSFTRTPYAEALRRGGINDEILHALAANLTDVEQVDLSLAEQLIKEKLG
ncbi:MAG: FAD-dependent monooxygenase [Bacteroidetes bacterium]|nr:FAD-dependent monooxygenase [Bacteroidota bacterium]